MFAGTDVVAHIHQGNSVIVVLFGVLELSYRALGLLVACIQVNGSSVCKLLAGARENLLQVGFRLVEFVLLHGAQTRYIVLHSLCKTRIVAYRFLRGGLLGHLQNSSCALRKCTSNL